MRLPHLLLAPALLLAACAADPATGPTADDAPPAPAPDLSIDPFSEAFDAPAEHVMEGAVFVPLEPSLAQVDYDAFMSSREHLHASLGWGTWPSAEGTVEENAKDLERHGREFDQHEAYAYAVLTPDRSAELACVYINPARPDSGLEAPAATVAYWVTAAAAENDFDAALLTELLHWFEAEWPLRAAAFPTLATYERGLLLAREARLTDEGEAGGRRLMVWRR